MENSTAKNPEEREQEIRHVLNLEVADMLAAANEAGYATGETLTVLEKLILERKIALAEDPDPAEDPA